MTSRTEIEPDEAAEEYALTLTEEAVANFEPLLLQIPEAGGDAAGYESILRQLAAAQDASELDAPWRAGGLQALRDTPIVITAVRRMPSEYESGLGWFLVVDAAVKGTGEQVTITTGMLAVVAQLAKAVALDALPWSCIPRRARKPSKRGYYAWHLESVR